MIISLLDLDCLDPHLLIKLSEWGRNVLLLTNVLTLVAMYIVRTLEALTFISMEHIYFIQAKRSEFYCPL